MKAVDWKGLTLGEFAEIISKALSAQGINAVLVGGACVSLYSRNKYESLDLDYVSPASTERIDSVLGGLGFSRKDNLRQYKRPGTRYYIEFPPGPISIGEEGPITRFDRLGSIVLLRPTDCVKDRLAAYFHWNDEQSLKQALLVAKSQKINLDEIRKWSVREKRQDKFRVFESLLTVK